MRGWLPLVGCAGRFRPGLLLEPAPDL